MSRQTNAEDEEQFLKELTKLGGSTRNVVLREALEWREPHYHHVRQRLIDDELVEIRPGGPGGTVYLKDKESDKQKRPTDLIEGVSADQRENIEESQKVGPLRFESCNTEANNVELVLSEMRRRKTIIPSYQRDSDQWDSETKSLFIETVINNLPSPALFFETTFDTPGIPTNKVVDGQQRLVTLCEFFDPSILQELDKEEFGLENNEELPKLRLVDIGRAPYISPNCNSYAGKTFSELPQEYQETFRSYRLSIIKLGDLGDLRCEVFRRINQGGIPLSGQDIRLAYYGEESPSVAFIRVVGVYDLQRKSAGRFINNARKLRVEYPWKDTEARATWNSIWEGKNIARGQTPSEMFLWSLLAAQYDTVDDIMKDKEHLHVLKQMPPKGIDDVLDVYCAQVQYQDKIHEAPCALMSVDEMEKKFFPHFRDFIHILWSMRAVHLNIQKHRYVANIIGATYREKIPPEAITKPQWGKISEFIMHPSDSERLYGVKCSESKGRWDSQTGYRPQMQAASLIIRQIVP